MLESIFSLNFFINLGSYIDYLDGYKLCVCLLRVEKPSDHITKTYKIFKVISFSLNFFSVVVAEATELSIYPTLFVFI